MDDCVFKSGEAMAILYIRWHSVSIGVLFQAQLMHVHGGLLFHLLPQWTCSDFQPRFVVWLTPSRDQVRTYQKALETSDIIHEANSSLSSYISSLCMDNELLNLFLPVSSGFTGVSCIYESLEFK